nr:reverse transcriptase domain-containing protein [Tanacetum cinerariifolium]
MSKASSVVTYTSVYTDSEPGRVFWGADEELSDGHGSSYPEEDPEEYEEDEAEDCPVDNPMDGGDDGDDEDDGDSSEYDANIEDEDDGDEEEEEEEHLAPADSAMVIPIDELTSISLLPEAEVERLLAMPTPSPSPLTSLLPPSAGERLARCPAPAALPSPPLPSFSYPSPPVDRRDGIPESEQPPCKRLCLYTLGFRYEVGESSTKGRGVDYGFTDTVEAEMRHQGIREVGYGIRDTWIDPAEAVPDMASTTLEKVNTRVAELAELHEHDTQDLYALLEDAQDGRTRISQRVAMDSQQIMAPVTRQGQNLPPPNTNTPPHHMTPESVQAMIDQALLRNSTNGDGSQSVVGLTRWMEKIESIFNISGCAIENQGELKKLEIELWILKVKGNDVPTYTNRFQELTLMCTKLVANKSEKIDKYISGLPDSIYRNVKSSKPRMLDETIENNHGHQQQPFKKQNVAKVYNMGTGERKPYKGSLPKSSGNANVANAERDGKETPKGMNGGNRNAQRWVYAVGNAEKNRNAPMNPDSNVGMGTFLLNNRYASILFDTGADRSFISIAFSSLVNIDPTPLGSSYDVELADGKIVGIDTIIRGCTINFLNHPFNIDLISVELGSFDVIIEMDWLRRCHAVIVCDKKLVQIPYGNETLTFRGNESNNRRESRLTVISCSKAQRYMAKGCQTFMAQISAKKEEDKSEGKQLKDVPIVRDFPEVFPEDLPGLSPARPVEFQIDLIPGAAPVALAPYRLAPSEMKELSKQLQELSDK